MEFISSRNNVPPLANSNRPCLSSAPVNPPFTVPNSIPSNRFAGKAAQFWAIKGLFFLLLALCIACTNNSFPVPVSPYINTGASVSAALRPIF